MHDRDLLGVEVEALRAIDVVLAFWDQEYFSLAAPRRSITEENFEENTISASEFVPLMPRPCDTDTLNREMQEMQEFQKGDIASDQAEIQNVSSCDVAKFATERQSTVGHRSETFHISADQENVGLIFNSAKADEAKESIELVGGLPSTELSENTVIPEYDFSEQKTTEAQNSAMKDEVSELHLRPEESSALADEAAASSTANETTGNSEEVKIEDFGEQKQSVPEEPAVLMSPVQQSKVSSVEGKSSSLNLEGIPMDDKDALKDPKTEENEGFAVKEPLGLDQVEEGIVEHISETNPPENDTHGKLSAEHKFRKEEAANVVPDEQEHLGTHHELNAEPALDAKPPKSNSPGKFSTSSQVLKRRESPSGILTNYVYKAGKAGKGMWKYITKHRGTNQEKNIVQFITVWSTPTPQAPVPPATAGVWWSFEKVKMFQSNVFNKQVPQQQEKKTATLTFRYEHSHMTQVVAVPEANIVSEIPKQLAALEDSKPTGIRFTAPYLRIPELIAATLSVSNAVFSNELLGRKVFGRAKDAVDSLDTQKLNGNGVPFEVIQELFRTENYPTLSAHEVLTRHHLRSDQTARVPDDAEEESCRIAVLALEADAQRKKKIEQRRVMRLNNRRVLASAEAAAGEK
ncbi:hypothetical protein HDU83_004416 [Entophlyctis luteolus]|nr:hypothetical protein HDU83_004416 [Entophlyctis luteolus]KAJ3383266.1 hypothetical protein HDU84_003745 [Entophlyctis sp. JEL0112]